MSGSSHVQVFEKAVRKPRTARRKLPPPVSIRFSEDERARLVREAGKLSLSAYIRQKLFGDNTSFRKARYLRK